MAVKTFSRGSGSGMLGTLGTLASLGGLLIPGAQWLTPLGLGLSATDSLLNSGGGGGGSDTVDALRRFKESIDGWQNPGSGNIAKSGNTTNAVANTATPTRSDEELNRIWGGYNQWRL